MRVERYSLEEEAGAVLEDIVLAELSLRVEAMAATVLEDGHADAIGVGDHSTGLSIDAGGLNIRSRVLGRCCVGHAGNGGESDEELAGRHGV